MPGQWHTSFTLLHQLIIIMLLLTCTHYTSIAPHTCNTNHSACQSHIAGCKPSRASIDEVAFTRDLITFCARSTVCWSPINSSVDSSTQFTAVIIWLINRLLITQNTYLLLSCLAHICDSISNISQTFSFFRMTPRGTCTNNNTVNLENFIVKIFL